MKINRWLNQDKYQKLLPRTPPPDAASDVTLGVLRSLHEWRAMAETTRPGSQRLHLTIPTLLENAPLQTLFFGDDPRMKAEVGLRLDGDGNFKNLLIKSLGLVAGDRAILEVLSLYSYSKRLNDLSILVAEPFSALSLQIRGRFPRAIASGYMPQSPGSLFPIKHIDLQIIDLPDDSMDVLITREVFEHLTDYPAALADAARILKSGGMYLFTCPFHCNANATTQRATLSAQGDIVHLLEPEYHSDPLRPSEGILVFQIPGWDILDAIRAAGFSDAAVCYLSNPRGGVVGKHYTGHFVFVCQK